MPGGRCRDNDPCDEGENLGKRSDDRLCLSGQGHARLSDFKLYHYSIIDIGAVNRFSGVKWTVVARGIDAARSASMIRVDGKVPQSFGAGRMNNQDESLQALERDLGLPKGFCVKLIEEDDWSFVIKLHALVESAVSELITRTVQRNELSDIFSRIEMSNTRTGKLAFVKALNLLPSRHIQFVHKLSELRNMIAHRIQNTGINLIEYFKTATANLAPKDLRKVGDLWGFGISIVGEKYDYEPLARHIMTIKPQKVLPRGAKISRSLYLIHKPKVVILWSALQILDAISICNFYGPQMWSFLMECEDQKGCEDWVHQIFDRAKVGDPRLPERIAQKFEVFTRTLGSGVTRMGSLIWKVWPPLSGSQGNVFWRRFSTTAHHAVAFNNQPSSSRFHRGGLGRRNCLSTD